MTAPAMTGKFPLSSISKAQQKVPVRTQSRFFPLENPNQSGAFSINQFSDAKYSNFPGATPSRPPSNAGEIRML